MPGPRARAASLVGRVAGAATRRVDIASLAAFRILFGLVMCGGIVRFLATGWIEPMYGDPRWFFTYPGFEWVRPWPVWGMYVHYGVLAVLALAIAAGAWFRAACALFVVGFAYTQLIDVTNYLNHNYLVVLIGAQLALLPAHAAWSVDARRHPALARAEVPAWMVWLLRFQIGVVYVFAGLAKAKPDWLLHGQPLGLWLAARTEVPLLGRWFAEPWVALAMSWAGFVFDTTIVGWLSWARTRVPAYVALVVFHGVTGYLFNIGLFPVIMTASALIFCSPGWPRRVLAALGRDPGTSRAAIPSDRADRPAASSWKRGSVLIAIALHVAVQLALPLRHLIYPGPVLWNEHGMRFAWHVLVREKHGTATFVAELEGGKRLEIPAQHYLTWRQEREMGGQPDLILQLARTIGADLRRRGYVVRALRASTQVSLNGRASVPMIDPDIDLLTLRDVGPRSWVTPAPVGPPPTVRPVR
jgi:hypothetical protein